jgi:hypothetical protein
VFVPDKIFQASLLFEGKEGAYIGVFFTFMKKCQGQNFESVSVVIKSFSVIKHFYLSVTMQKNKLAYFARWDHSQTLNKAE